jgi:hypothetical protein
MPLHGTFGSASKRGFVSGAVVNVPISFLIVGGGGAGGDGNAPGGGGGAGGLGVGTLLSGTVKGQLLSINIGAGGSQIPLYDSSGSAGGNTSFGSITAYGGGSGGSYGQAANYGGGGSGGGGAGPTRNNNGSGAGGGGSTAYGATISWYAYAGGNWITGGAWGGGGGGGGAGGAGGAGSASSNSGAGYTSSISGSSVTYAAGGPGAAISYNGASTGGVLGSTTPGSGGSGTADITPGYSVGYAGILIVSIPISFVGYTASGFSSKITVGSNYVHTWTGSGSIQF